MSIEIGDTVTVVDGFDDVPFTGEVTGLYDTGIVELSVDGHPFWVMEGDVK